ncbi:MULTISPECIES: FliA/WhiG family RNA polymerase sigma factor [Brevibacillus]|uniref:RNA polymerase sigma factor n=1 Tax=Brevibacillus parabrevis TaxID=54914 RepID=A0A4Y3PBF0_BREPA|nr:MULTISPECIES: FliA/WhiG family RNA polymerase sigma factor [Brevibacillus]NRQ53667.1 FliA/WhiG family RNA polymerase sigma factor [Brevibacillus sp. HD1.4A]KZE53096.1 RNA polymerase subunit sigma [Brevibacillus parabrevis]MBU8711388.1 FliA/WhiG family RNA polymerase sigma factor [Brevibacillus parabrevis]MDH6349984.1 RNA polymerase sigma factor for flagellar operon FliA [Brevibacillus sp. 1238]MDR4999436.1 FliA/WhiG family RNA polymerase sigma factor [Brevibacillus parabrevis]
MARLTSQEKAKEFDKWVMWKQEGSREAEVDLITKFLPLVDKVANRLAINLPANVDKDDLISYGRFGLLDALAKFDHTRGLQFETYAMWRIRGAMIDGLRENDWIPRTVRDKAKKIEEAYTTLEQQMLRMPTDQEVSEYLGISEKDLQQVFLETSLASMVSIDEAVGEEDEQKTARHSYIVDELTPRPESVAEVSSLKEVLVGVIDKLPEKERLVVSLFYFEELTLSEIAEIMSLSPSRISQLHSKALFRLRSALSRWKSQLL